MQITTRPIDCNLVNDCNRPSPKCKSQPLNRRGCLVYIVTDHHLNANHNYLGLGALVVMIVTDHHLNANHNQPAQSYRPHDCNRPSPKCKSQLSVGDKLLVINCNRPSPKCKSQLAAAHIAILLIVTDHHLNANHN